MAAKHDAKRAREHMWVTRQNLARAKGGRPHYEHKEKASLVKKGPGAPPPSAEAKPADVPPASSEASAEDTKE